LGRIGRCKNGQSFLLFAAHGDQGISCPFLVGDVPKSPLITRGWWPPSAGWIAQETVFFAVPINANIAKLHELPSGRAAICNGSKQDAGFRNMMAQYEKASVNTIDVSIVPIAPRRQKIVSALTGPDLMEDYNAGRDGGPAECPER